MFNVGGFVIPNNEKVIKVIREIEEIEGEYVLYMTDCTSYHVTQLQTINNVAEREGFEI